MPKELIENCLRENGYTLGRSLGKGGEGQVYLVTKNNKEYVAKVLLNKTTSYEKLARDLRGCEYVVYLLDIFTRENISVYIMPKCETIRRNIIDTRKAI